MMKMIIFPRKRHSTPNFYIYIYIYIYKTIDIIISLSQIYYIQTWSYDMLILNKSKTIPYSIYDHIVDFIIINNTYFL